MKLICSAVCLMIATGAYAGGLDAPLAEETVMAPVVVEEQSSGSGDFVIPLMVLAVLAAVAASD